MSVVVRRGFVISIVRRGLVGSVGSYHICIGGVGENRDGHMAAGMFPFTTAGLKGCLMEREPRSSLTGYRVDHCIFPMSGEISVVVWLGFSRLVRDFVLDINLVLSILLRHMPPSSPCFEPVRRVQVSETGSFVQDSKRWYFISRFPLVALERVLDLPSSIIDGSCWMKDHPPTSTTLHCEPGSPLFHNLTKAIRYPSHIPWSISSSSSSTNRPVLSPFIRAFSANHPVLSTLSPPP